MKTITIAFAVVGLSAGSAAAQLAPPVIPPANSMKLSQIMAKVEARATFQYVAEVEWSQSGYYDVFYFTTDKAKVELHLDPVTGETR